MVHTLKPIYQVSNHRIVASWFHHAPKHFKLMKFKAALVPLNICKLNLEDFIK